MKVSCVLKFVFILLISLIQASFAKDEIKELVIVRPDGSWPPLEMVEEGKLSGFHIELIQHVAQDLGLNIRFESLPWKRAIEIFKKGDADAITYMAKTSQREEFGYFFEGNVLSKATVGFFINKNQINKVSFSGDLNSLLPYSIGTVLGFSYHEEFDQMTSLNKFNAAENEENLLNMLVAGRIQVAIGHLDDIGYHAKRLGLADKIVFLKPYLKEGREHYVVFSKAKKHYELARVFSKEMKRYKSTENYLKLKEKYGLSE